MLLWKIYVWITVPKDRFVFQLHNCRYNSEKWSGGAGADVLLGTGDVGSCLGSQQLEGMEDKEIFSDLFQMYHLKDCHSGPMEPLLC